jgi:hypothetical protein
MTDQEAQSEKERVKAEAAKDAEIKSKYNAVLKEVHEEDGKEYVAYFKVPGRAFIGAAMGQVELDPLKAAEILFDGACIREVSDVDKFRNDDGLLIDLWPKLQKLIPLKKSRSIRL